MHGWLGQTCPQLRVLFLALTYRPCLGCIARSISPQAWSDRWQWDDYENSRLLDVYCIDEHLALCAAWAVRCSSSLLIFFSNLSIQWKSVRSINLTALVAVQPSTQQIESIDQMPWSISVLWHCDYGQMVLKLLINNKKYAQMTKYNWIIVFWAHTPKCPQSAPKWPHSTSKWPKKLCPNDFFFVRPNV